MVIDFFRNADAAPGGGQDQKSPKEGLKEDDDENVDFGKLKKKKKKATFIFDGNTLR